MNQDENPVAEFLARLRNNPLVQDLIEWLREPPGLYVGLGFLLLLIILFIKKTASSTEKGQARLAEKKLRGNLLAELKAYRKEKNWNAVASVYERLGEPQKALEFYKKAGKTLDQARIYIDLGERDKAKNIMEAGGHFEELARTCEKDREWARAASAYERAGKTLTAAEAYEKAGDKERAARLYKEGGLESKASELYAAKGGREAAELLDKDIRVVNARSKGAAMKQDQIDRVRRCIKLWIDAGEAERAYRLATDLEQWKLVVPVAVKHLPPSPRTAEACILAGALLEAADIFERAGDIKQGALTRAQHHQKKNEQIEAARYFEIAEDWNTAGELYQGLGQFEKAAELYGKGGDPRLAAEMWAAAGMPAKAAEIYESLGESQMAATAYNLSANKEKEAEMLAAGGNHFGAGEIFRNQGRLDKAIAEYQQVEEGESDFRKSRVALGEVFLEKGEKAPAKAAFERACDGTKISAETVGGFYGLARMAELEGHVDEAKRLYEQISAQQYGYRDVAMRLRAIADGRPLSGPGGTAHAATSASYGKTVAAGMGPASAGRVNPAATLPTAENRYELGPEVGRGGMGVVYRATDRTLGRQVAYKALPADLKNHPKAAENLLAEARAAAQLSHPNIVQVYDAGRDERGYFIVMELVTGQTFDKILKEKKISISGVVNIARQICAALSHAHGKRIVHRDLKPSNLFWTSEKTIKLMDFGLARAYDESVGNVQTRSAGTPYYMAPEQIRGEAIDPRTDIYALGCVLYELLCNRPPFTSGELSYHHVHTAPENPRKFREEIPDALASIVLKCLAKSPDARYGSVADVEQALRSIA